MNTIIGSYLEEIDAKIEAKSLLKHPFYRAWSKGELTLDSLRDYACQYYQQVKAFPTCLSAVHAQTEDIPTRREILRNLTDEEAGDPNHPDLWIRFGEGLGLTRGDMERALIRAETAKLINTFRSVCRDRGTAAGLAAIYAYESQVPAVSESKIDGLRRFYSIDDPRTLDYFRVHIDADKEHAAAERARLAAHLDDGNAATVFKSVDESLDALWGMLDGVNRQNGIGCK
jgi:pyrroloquinoline-quinone synthase